MGRKLKGIAPAQIVSLQGTKVTYSPRDAIDAEAEREGAAIQRANGFRLHGPRPARSVRRMRHRG